MGCQSRNSHVKVKSQVNSRRVHCRRRASAPGLFPQAWRIAGAGLGLPAGAGCRHPTMLGAKPRRGIPPQHCHNFFGIADASRFKDQTPNQGLFTCSYPRADFDMPLLMNFLPSETGTGIIETSRLQTANNTLAPTYTQCGEQAYCSPIRPVANTPGGLDTSRYQQHLGRTRVEGKPSGLFKFTRHNG